MFDLRSWDYTRTTIHEDHSYARVERPENETESVDLIIVEPNVGEIAKSASPDEDSWVDFDNSTIKISLTDQQNSSDAASKLVWGCLGAIHDPNPLMQLSDSHTDCANVQGKKARESCSSWMPVLSSLQRKVTRLLERCMLEESIFTFEFQDCSRAERAKRIAALQHLKVRRLARHLRTTFSKLFWRMEHCLVLHQWCLETLPQKLLLFYLDGFLELWRQKKVNALLGNLNELVMTRGLCTRFPYNQFLQRLHAHSADIQTIPSSGAARPFSSVFCQPMSTCSATTSVGYSRRMPGEDVVLVCFTYPISRKSQRLRNLLQHLSDFARISIETAEEQNCETLSARLCLFTQRVLSLLEESRSSPVFLVGFGVSSLLVLLSTLRIRPPERVNDSRPAPWVAGAVCIGIPLQGLKGARGVAGDPLLTIPALPILLVVGEGSRLGGLNEAVVLRDSLLQARRERQLSQTLLSTGVGGASMRQISDSVVTDLLPLTEHSDVQSKQSGINIVLVGGADHFLRLRPSTCRRWIVTQETVDKRVIANVRQFVFENRRAPAVVTNCVTRSQHSVISSVPSRPTTTRPATTFGVHSSTSPSQYRAVSVTGGVPSRLHATHDRPTSTSTATTYRRWSTNRPTGLMLRRSTKTERPTAPYNYGRYSRVDYVPNWPREMDIGSPSDEEVDERFT